MKKGLYAILAALAIFALAMVGCDNGGGGGGGDDPGGPKQITITFNANIPAGVEVIAPEPIPSRKITEGAAIGALPDAPQSVDDEGTAIDYLPLGLYFLGWSDTDGGELITAAKTFAADATVYAKWLKWDPATKVTIIFDANYDDGPITLKTIDKDDSIPAADWPEVTRPGTYTNGDKWVFTRWTQYDFGSGDIYTADVSVFSASRKIYAQWKPENGWPVEDPPATADMARAEKVILKNGNFAMYIFEIPADSKWSNYKNITAQIMVGSFDLDTDGSCRNYRLMGNYQLSDIENFIEPIDGNLERLAATGFGNGTDPATNKNGPFIMHNGPQWTTIRNGVKEACGVDVKPWEWFDSEFDITGTKKHGEFAASSMPDANYSGTLIFALGISGNQDAGTTSWVRDVRLVGNTGVASVTAKPLYIKKDGEVYPAFASYSTPGGNGVQQSYRGMVDGSEPETVDAPEAP